MARSINAVGLGLTLPLGKSPARQPEISLANEVLAEAEADLLLVGHIHEPFSATSSKGGLIVRPGALGSSTVEAPWLLDRETGKFVQSAPRAGTFALVELPGMDVRIVKVTGKTSA